MRKGKSRRWREGRREGEGGENRIGKERRREECSRKESDEKMGGGERREERKGGEGEQER